MKTYKLVGDKVKVTIPAEERFLDVEPTYEQAKSDLVQIDREIAEYEARIQDALSRKADREAHVSLVETKVLEIREERRLEQERLEEERREQINREIIVEDVIPKNKDVTPTEEEVV